MRRLLLPGLCCIVALIILVALGTWQVERMHWKRAALADIAAAEARPGIPLPDNPAPYTKIRVHGRLRHDLAALYGAEGRQLAAGPTMGAQLVMPLERPGAPPVLVVLGWVPALPPPTPPAEATIDGYIRAPDHAGPFAAADNQAARRFYTLNPATIAAALGLPTPAPYTIVALGPPGVPDPARTLPRPNDNHLSYALTWYGLALSLAGVFSIFARKVLRP